MRGNSHVRFGGAGRGNGPGETRGTAPGPTPYCRAPAHGTDGDHTQDWARGGVTHDDNIGSACRHDHRLKHEGGWIVRQPVPGHFVWTSRLGRHYYVRPPLIIQSLPDPIPRDPPPPF